MFTSLAKNIYVSSEAMLSGLIKTYKKLFLIIHTINNESKLNSMLAAGVTVYSVARNYAPINVKPHRPPFGQ